MPNLRVRLAQGVPAVPDRRGHPVRGRGYEATVETRSIGELLIAEVSDWQTIGDRFDTVACPYTFAETQDRGAREAVPP
jgi:hypothetical protein